MQVVVLVDESGSLSEEDVAREREAARTIALGVLAPESTVSVVGFGSSNAAGQSPVDPVCPPTVIDSPQARDALAECIGDLRSRTPGEGADTDHVAALRQALSYLDDGRDQPKIVFLLTDGLLDVANSEFYGRDLSPEARTEAARDQIPGVLADLDRIGAQVWPLGFGDVDQASLEAFQAGQSCADQVPDPVARVATDPALLLDAVIQAYSAATCVDVTPIVRDRLLGDTVVELTVDVPVIASDASILVFKRDARIQVAYVDPNGVVAEGADGPDGSRFEFAGQGTETESLRIIDPVPGTWTVRLSSAPDVPDQDVAATVLYQGAINTVLSVSPPVPAAGQTVDIDMGVRTRRQGVTDPELLAGLSFVAGLTGSSGAAPQEVTLTDPERDGTFSGQLTVPQQAAGDLVFTGRVSGIGVGGDERVFNTRVQSGPADIQGQILLQPEGATVTPGGSVPGEVAVTNTSGAPARLRLQVADPSPGADITIDPAIVDAPVGSTQVPFMLRVGPDSAIGGTQATLRLVEDADPGSVVAERLFATDVAPEPTIWERLLLLWIALAVLLLGLAAFLVAKLRSARRAASVRGLKAQLHQGGFLLRELTPRDPNARSFRFTLQNDFQGVQLLHAGPADPTAFVIERAGGGVSMTPAGDRNPIMGLGEHRPVGPDLTVSIVEEAGTLPVASGGGSFAGGGASDGTSFGGSAFDAPPTSPPPPRSAADPFANSYADPFAGGTANGAPTTNPAPPDDRAGGSPPSTGPRPPGRGPTPDTYVDPNNPF